MPTLRCSHAVPRHARRVAGAFAAIAGVIGYDPLNEPWGDERREIAPLYRDAAAALRARHPSAILFLESRGPTAAGIRTRLPEPGLDNVAFAPHYYKPLAIVLEDWGGQTAAINRAFDRMEAKAAEWGVPLILGEIGIPGGAGGAGDYVDYLYDRLDAALASGLQWSVAPHWTAENATDGTAKTSACSRRRRARPNYRPRPYPHRVAGVPVASDSNRTLAAGMPATGVRLGQPSRARSDRAGRAGRDLPAGTRPRSSPTMRPATGTRRDGS